MKKISIIILAFIIMTSTTAQTQTVSPAGEYYLRGVMETASGFKLNPDSTFEFFFSYGALDRYGSGTWSLQDGKVILNSRPRPPKDFAMINSGKTKDKALHITITDQNQGMLRYVECIVKSGDKTLQETTDQYGKIKLPLVPVDSISLIFHFCPEKVSIFKIENKEHNNFEFRFEPWLVELFFENFHLQADGKNLKGKHPLLNGEEYNYEKGR